MDQNPYEKKPTPSRQELAYWRKRELYYRKILGSHTEIMDKQEQSALSSWYQVAQATILFVIMVQIPLSLKYYLLAKRDPKTYGHLRLRIFLFPLVFIPYKYSATKIEDKYRVYGEKYLSEMNME